MVLESVIHFSIFKDDQTFSCGIFVEHQCISNDDVKINFQFSKTNQKFQFHICFSALQLKLEMKSPTNFYWGRVICQAASQMHIPHFHSMTLEQSEQ